MSDNIDALILDFLEWLEHRPRAYAEVIEAWGTSCPRLPVWEDAVDRGLVCRERAADGWHITVTADGHDFLAAHGRRPAARRSAAG